MEARAGGRDSRKRKGRWRAASRALGPSKKPVAQALNHAQARACRDEEGPRRNHGPRLQAERRDNPARRSHGEGDRRHSASAKCDGPGRSEQGRLRADPVDRHGSLTSDLHARLACARAGKGFLGGGTPSPELDRRPVQLPPSAGVSPPQRPEQPPPSRSRGGQHENGKEGCKRQMCWRSLNSLPSGQGSRRSRPGASVAPAETYARHGEGHERLCSHRRNATIDQTPRRSRRAMRLAETRTPTPGRRRHRTLERTSCLGVQARSRPS